MVVREDRRTVLMIAHRFPPSRGMGVHRPLGFARHLPNLGWHPIVLTVDEPLDADSESALLDGLPPEVEILRTAWPHPRIVARRMRRRLGAGGASRAAGGSRDSGTHRLLTQAKGLRGRLRLAVHRYLLVPDVEVTWLPFALVAALRAWRRHGPYVLWSTYAPATNHLVALIVANWTGARWVADFRDTWSDTLSEETQLMYESAWRAALERAMERRVLERADNVVAVSEGQAALLAAHLPAAERGKVCVLPNGFDAEAYAGLRRRRPAVLTIVHTGTFYPRYRDPRPFLEGLALLCEEEPAAKTGVRVLFLGSVDDSVRKRVVALGLEKVVEFVGHVPHQASLQAQLDASAPLLIVGREHARGGALTGKVFEYLASRRPMLALVPHDSEVAQLIQSSGAGCVVPPDDPEAIARAVSKLWHRFEREGDLPWRGDEDQISAYDRVRLSERLAELLAG